MARDETKAWTGVSKVRQVVSAMSMMVVRCSTPVASSLDFAEASIVCEPSSAWISAAGKRRARAVQRSPSPQQTSTMTAPSGAGGMAQQIVSIWVSRSGTNQMP